MPPKFWFWLLMVIWLFYGAWVDYYPSGPQPFFYRGSRHLLAFLLLAILGWQVFGSPFEALVK